MNNLFAQSRSHWVRYDRYEIKTGKDGKRYITPENTAKPDVYNPLKEAGSEIRACAHRPRLSSANCSSPLCVEPITRV